MCCRLLPWWHQHSHSIVDAVRNVSAAFCIEHALQQTTEIISITNEVVLAHSYFHSLFYWTIPVSGGLTQFVMLRSATICPVLGYSNMPLVFHMVYSYQERYGWTDQCSHNEPGRQITISVEYFDNILKSGCSEKFLIRPNFSLFTTPSHCWWWSICGMWMLGWSVPLLLFDRSSLCAVYFSSTPYNTNMTSQYTLKPTTVTKTYYTLLLLA